MNEDGPNDSPYETLAKHDQSEMKCDTQEYVPEPAYADEQELEIARLVSTYNPHDNNDTAESLLDSPLDLIYATTGHIKVT
jgi:hypothetical protein